MIMVFVYGLATLFALVLLFGNFFMVWNPDIESDDKRALALALVLFAVVVDAGLVVLVVILALGYGVQHVIH